MTDLNPGQLPKIPRLLLCFENSDYKGRKLLLSNKKAILKPVAYYQMLDYSELSSSIRVWGFFTPFYVFNLNSFMQNKSTGTFETA